MLMKNIIILLIVIFFAGCTSHGYGIANHNGKTYWFPNNCPYYTYSYDNPDVLYCTNENSVKTGRILYPASQADVQNYYAEQQYKLQYQQMLNQQTNNFYMQQQTQQLQNMNNQMMLQNLQQLRNSHGGWYR
ncbi:MAG: hypothetical protein LBD84_01980 [Campylobacteraceae bacterium]|nr:hypothetical protein [Campylobacteraceae bacterium]